MNFHLIEFSFTGHSFESAYNGYMTERMGWIPRQTEPVRFKILRDITKGKLIITSDGCWVEYDANINKYSQCQFKNKQVQLHILSAMLFLEIDLNKNNSCVCHKCDIKACFNPSHLYLGSDHSNARDRVYRLKNKTKPGEVINRPPHNPESEISFLQ